jgi:hypothetical protein
MKRLMVIILITLFLMPCVAHGTVYELTSADLPYTVLADYDTIRIAEKCESATSGININAHDRVVIQLYDSLKFGGGGGDDNYGVWTNWGGQDITIEGDGYGTIFHDDGGIDTASGNDCIYITNAHDILISNVNMVADGEDGKCIYISGSSYKIEIDDGTYRSDSRRFTSRCTTSGCIINLYTESSWVPGPDEYHFTVSNITITNGPHVGISLLHNSVTKCRVDIHDNNITLDAINEKYPVSDGNTCHSPGNAYCIGLYGVMEGSKIYNNYGTCGTDNYGCEGMLLQDAKGTETDTIDVWGNEFHVWYGPYIHQSIGKVSALYWRFVPGETGTDCRYNWIHDNEFYAYIDADTNTGHIGRDAEVVSTYWQDTCHHNLFESNHTELISYSSEVYWYANALGVNNDDTTNAMFAGVKYNKWKNNYWKSPKAPISLGGSRGWGGNNLILDGDTIDCPNTGDTSSIRFGKGAYRNHSLGNRMRDIVWLGEANDSDIVYKFQGASDADSLGQGVCYERTFRIYVLDSQNNPIEDALVEVDNNYSQTVLSDSTDTAGHVSNIVPYKYVHDNQYGPDYDSVFNEMIITVTIGEDITLDTFALGADAAIDTIWAQSASQQQTSPKKKILKKRIIIIMEEYYGFMEEVIDSVFHLINRITICYRDKFALRSGYGKSPIL